MDYVIWGRRGNGGSKSWGWRKERCYNLRLYNVYIGYSSAIITNISYYPPYLIAHNIQYQIFHIIFIIPYYPPNKYIISPLYPTQTPIPYPPPKIEQQYRLPMSSNVKRRVIQNYTLHQLLGQGVYGKVYKAKHKQTPDQFAIKVIPVQLFKQSKKLEECTVHQINTLSYIPKCPYIIKYVEMLKTSNNFYFVYEFCNGGTLESLIKKEKVLGEKRALEIIRQMVEAFKVLIKHNIMHRDIKPDNILFHDGVVKLGDFGFCKNLESRNAMTSTMLGSPIYMAPEMLKGEEYSTKADIWSLGVVLFEILFGYCPFESNSIANLISTIRDSNLKLPLEINPISEGTQHLIKRMLVKDPAERVSWEQIFSMEFFQTEEGKGKEQKKEENGKVKKEEEVSKGNEKSNGSESQPAVVSVGKPLNGSVPKSESKEREIRTEPKMAKKDSLKQKTEQKVEEKPPVSLSQESKVIDTIPVSHSISWQNDTGFKNYLANATPHSKINKPSVETGLPQQGSSINKIGNLDNFFATPSNVLESISQSVSNSVSQSITQSISQSINANYLPLPQISPKRKEIILEHELCTRGIKIAIDIINVEENTTLTYSYLLLTKIQSKLRKIQDSILSTQTELQDIHRALSQQLTNLQRSILELKDQLVQQDISLKNLDNPKGYLSVRFKQTEGEQTLRLWYDMVWVLFGENKTAMGWSRDKDREQMIEYIRGRLL